MNCPNCGAQLSEDATFCNKCGYSMLAINNVNNSNYTNKKNNNNNAILLTIAITSAVVVFMIVAIITFILYNRRKTNSVNEMPVATVAQITSSPTQETQQEVKIVYLTPEPASQPKPESSIYKQFYSSKYDYACDYPSDFKAYDDGGTLTLYTAKSPDGRGVEKIVAKPNEGETVSSEYEGYKREHAGIVDYESVGNTYFALLINDGSYKYYKYCTFRHNNLYWFEMIYPVSEQVKYDQYINDIYKSIRIHGESLKYN